MAECAKEGCDKKIKMSNPKKTIVYYGSFMIAFYKRIGKKIPFWSSWKMGIYRKQKKNSQSKSSEKTIPRTPSLTHCYSIQHLKLQGLYWCSEIQISSFFIDLSQLPKRSLTAKTDQIFSMQRPFQKDQNIILK